MAPSSLRVRVLILIALSVLAYWPTLRLPFIGDDYDQIPIARADAAAGWQPLWHDTLLRTRFTHMWLSATLESPFRIPATAILRRRYRAACPVRLGAVCDLSLARGATQRGVLGRRVFCRSGRSSGGGRSPENNEVEDASLRAPDAGCSPVGIPV